MDFKQLRKKLGLSQTEFWGRVGCTQSCASRYESGRTVPRAVQSLLRIAYGTVAQAAREVDRLRDAKHSLAAPQ